ncbi:hypothetical protein RC859_003065 [Vibrio alginolyticus]|nr:hypothetical protein [Vibrio alginolyticus]
MRKVKITLFSFICTFPLLNSGLLFAESDMQVDPAPSGLERNEILVNERSVVGHPGKDAGELRGNHFDFERNTDAATENKPEHFDPDTTTVIYENE